MRRNAFIETLLVQCVSTCPTVENNYCGVEPSSYSTSQPSSEPSSAPTSYPTNSLRSTVELHVLQKLQGITAAQFDQQARDDFITAVWKSLTNRFPNLRKQNFAITGVSEVTTRRLLREVLSARRLATELEVDYAITYVAEELGCTDCTGGIYIINDGPSVDSALRETIEDPGILEEVRTTIVNESQSSALQAAAATTLQTPEFTQEYTLLSFTSSKPTGQPSGQPSGRPSSQPSAPADQPTPKLAEQQPGPTGYIVAGVLCVVACIAFAVRIGHNKMVGNKKVMPAIVVSNADTVIETPVPEQERPPATGKYMTVSDDDSDCDTPIFTQASVDVNVNVNGTAMRAESRKIEEGLQGLLNPTPTASISIQSQAHISNTEKDDDDDDVLQKIVDAKDRTKPSVSSSPTAMHMQPSVSLASGLVTTAMTQAIESHAHFSNAEDDDVLQKIVDAKDRTKPSL